MATQALQPKQQQGPRKRVMHQLDTPFTTVAWPEITSQDQDVLLELLCSLLAPIGRHRQEHMKKSKGKRAKRKARSESASKENDPLIPPEPPITEHVDVGFNCITKILQAQSLPRHEPKNTIRSYSAVFVSRGDQSPVFNCHFPQMVGAAARSMPQGNKTRLVGFSKACSERLSICLGVPRVSSVAIVADAPGTTALQETVRGLVPAIDVPWLSTSLAQEYKPTKINSIETTVGNKKTRMK